MAAEPANPSLPPRYRTRHLPWLAPEAGGTKMLTIWPLLLQEKTARDRLRWAPRYAAMQISGRHLSPEGGHCVGLFVIFVDTSLQESEAPGE